MSKNFYSVGEAFPKYEKHFDHDHAESCAKSLIKADRKGSVVLGFLGEAVHKAADEKNGQKIRKVIQAILQQIKEHKKNSKKLNLSKDGISQYKKLRDVFKKQTNGKDEKVETAPAPSKKEAGKKEIVPTYWQEIKLPTKYSYPQAENKDKPGIYATEFPTTPLAWFLDPESKEYRSTSVYWISDKLDKISGISFKGFIRKENLGARENEFAVFFHEKRLYDGGPEYGFVFPENSHQGFFYILTDANLKNQHWAQWPGDLKPENENQGILQAIGNLSEEKYWNIKIEKNGDFLIEIVDPKTWKIESLTIKKPDFFPNLHEKSGYITICAQKRKDPTVHPTPFLSIDQVKTWV